MSDRNNAFPLMISIVVMNATQLASVYALLGGTALASGNVVSGPAEPAKSVIVPASAGNETLAPASQESAGTGPSATTIASPSDAEVDAHGWAWSPELHASTQTKTKDGLWRMKVGVQRPDPKPGFPIPEGEEENIGTASETPMPSVTLPTATEAESVQPAISTEDEDEFAAFREAAAASDAADQAAVASVPERTYSDADLGALCNQAAVKIGDPSPIKEIIATYVPEGQVAHSRNIPEDKRAEFVAAVEGKAGIEFAG